jgi:hypothetical protein
VHRAKLKSALEHAFLQGLAIKPIMQPHGCFTRHLQPASILQWKNKGRNSEKLLRTENFGLEEHQEAPSLKSNSRARSSARFGEQTHHATSWLFPIVTCNSTSCA